jgi:N-hydroxyarylamine O-acetyltransferase
LQDAHLSQRRDRALLTDIALYLERLGYDQAPPPSLATLQSLQQRHTAAFAFETISSLLRQPVPIDLLSLQRKLLHEGRGGYCYELNRMLLALLQQLGFQARGLTGRVVMGAPEDELTARTHLLVLATVEGVQYVVDVGFGGMVPTAPLRLDTEQIQATAHEPYRIVSHRQGYLLQAQVLGQWRAMYVFDLLPQSDIDYEVGNWYVSTHPDSNFLGQLRAARTGNGWRKTLGNGSFAIHRLDRPSERWPLPDADAVLQVLQQEFGLRLPAGPALREAIAETLQHNSPGAD